MGARTTFIGWLLSAACAFAQASQTGAPSARELHSAQCVAALQASTEALAQQVKAGNDAARPVLQGRLEAGTAFVGTRTFMARPMKGAPEHWQTMLSRPRKD